MKMSYNESWALIATQFRSNKPFVKPCFDNTYQLPNI